jgi:alcohol dehydrogenase
LTNPGNLKEYLEKPWSKPSIPVITIPTTAGTGAEVTPAGVIILPEERVKGWFNGVQATVAIVDPLMSLTMPPKLTAATGIDALSHAIESALSTEAFPLTRTLAIEAIKLISRNLRRATYHGNDLEARYNMALAALLAGLSEGNAGDIEAHAIAHVIGAFYQIPHGIACGIALPYVMEYNLPVNEETLAHLASVMGEDTSGLSLREAAYKGIYATKELIEDVGLPVALKGVEGVDRKDIPEIVELFKTSPRIAAFFNFCKRKMTEENAIRLFEKMWNGMLGKPKS